VLRGDRLGRTATGDLDLVAIRARADEAAVTVHRGDLVLLEEQRDAGP
jgi:hypothetical protein